MAINRKPGFYWVYEVYPTGWIVAQHLGNGTWITTAPLTMLP
jgi:hypothetical protein